MTLRRVNRITVENWRNWEGESTIDNLPAGVVVLAGPNAVGKTGLWEAVVGGLLDRHWGTHTNRLRPAGTRGVIPRVTIDFTAGDRSYRVEKSFSNSRDKASLWEHVAGAWQIRDEGEEAYLLCRRAVLGEEDDAPNRGGPEKALQGTLMEVLLPPQGHLTSAAPAPEAVSMAVTDREAATAATRVGRVLAAVSTLADQVWVPKRGKLKTGSQLQKDGERRDEIEQAILPLTAKADRIGQLVKDLSTSAENAAGQTDVGAQAAQADRLRREAKEHREQREASRESHASAKSVHEEIVARFGERRSREKLAAEAAATVGKIERELETQEEKHQRAGRHYEDLKQRRDALDRDVVRHRTWVEFESRESELEGLRKSRNEVVDRIRLVGELEEEIARRTAEARELKLPDKTQWARIDHLREQLQEARGELNAGAWSVTGSVPDSLALRIDGTAAGPGEVDARATREVVIGGEGGKELQIHAPGRSGEKVGDLEAELSRIFDGYGVPDHKELRRRFNYLEAEVKGAIKTARTRLTDALAGGDKTDLLRDQLDLEARIERKNVLTAPTTPRPDGVPEEWKIRLSILEEDLTRTGQEIERAGPELGSLTNGVEKARQALQGARQELELASEALREHRERHGSDDELSQSLLRAEADLEEKRKIWSRLDEARPMAEQAREARADKLSAGLKEVLSARDRIRELSAEIEALRREDPEGALADLEAERARLLPRIRAAETQADSLILLEQALTQEKDRVTSAIGEPVRERLQSWVTYLLQDESTVIVDEAGRPAVIRTPAGREVTCEDQSFGTREQISILHRLAIADLVADEAGAGVVVMLDDPFGHTDRGRRSRMLDILTAEAERRGHQILIFTCRPEDFEGVGTHIRVDGR